MSMPEPADATDVPQPAGGPDAGTPDFGLADDDAARLLGAVVAEVRAEIERGELDRREALVRLGDGIAVFADRFPDVNDATTRLEIQREVNPALEANGEEGLSTFEW